MSGINRTFKSKTVIAIGGVRITVCRCENNRVELSLSDTADSPIIIYEPDGKVHILDKHRLKETINKT